MTDSGCPIYRGVHLIEVSVKRESTVLISATRQVQRSLDCRVGDHGFDSWDQTNTRGLKKIMGNGGTPCALQTARPLRGSDEQVKF